MNFSYLVQFTSDLNFIDGTNTDRTLVPASSRDNTFWCETIYPQENFQVYETPIT